MSWLEIADTAVKIGLGALIGSLSGYLSYKSLDKNRLRYFYKDFRDALKYSQPSWEEIKEIAETRELTQAEVQIVIREFHRDIMVGKDTELTEYKDIVKSYIEQYKKDEPFEAMPSEIRLHLERLREQLNGSEHFLVPLTDQIKELLALNMKEKRIQRFFTTGGFFVGVLGLAYAVYISISAS